MSLLERLKVSIPILASVVNSMVEDPCIGLEQAAGMLDRTVEDFRNLWLEFISDTGAAHDIRSFKALAHQGFDRQMLKCFHKPCKLFHGRRTPNFLGGASHMGKMNLHLLKNWPYRLANRSAKAAPSFGSMAKFRSLLLITRGWYPTRVQNDVPICSLHPSGGPQQGLNFNHNKKLYQPAVVAECPESCFCGNCLERIPACVCSTYPEENRLKVGDQEIPAFSACEVPVGGVVATGTNKEHGRKQHRKDNKRRNWEAMKKTCLVEKGQKNSVW